MANIQYTDYNTHITALDIFAIACVFGISLFLFVISLASNNTRTEVEIRSEEGTFIYSLEEDKTLLLDGPLGETRVFISEGVVDVLSSPGNRQICVNSAPISQAGQWLVCLPNKIFIQIKGTGDTGDDVDAVVF